MTTTSIQSLASEARALFHESTRTDGSKYLTYDHSTAPDWIQPMCLEAHGDMSPDDHRYAFIVEALDALAEFEDSDDAEVEADIYTHELTSWLASRADRSSYCDEWMSDTGSTFTNTIDLIMGGQYQEKREVLDSVRSFLESRIADSDDQDETDND